MMAMFWSDKSDEIFFYHAQFENERKMNNLRHILKSILSVLKNQLI